MPNTRTPHRPRLVGLALLVLLTCASCSASTVYVNQNAPGPIYDGSSWATAFGVVTAGLNAATPGDEVWVASGTYQENLTLKSGVGLFGGFVGTETGRSQRNPSANVTTLDGQYKATVVTIAASATTSTVVDGFTIIHGSGPIANGFGAGGGVYIGGGTPIVSNNTIANCYAVGGQSIASYGGGIYINAGMPLVASNLIRFNHAINGGGIYALGGLIRDNVIAGNDADTNYYFMPLGGGIYLGPSAVAVHNIITDNGVWYVYGGGGGAVCDGGALLDNVIENNTSFHSAALLCYRNATANRNLITSSATQGIQSQVELLAATFSDNLILSKSGYGIALGSQGTYQGKETLISNNTIIKSGPQSDIAVISDYTYGEHPVFANNIVVGWATAGTIAGTHGTPPVVTVEHNDSYGNANNALSFPGGSPIGVNGNISQDPLFVDAANGDYRLQAGSPCIDTGNDAYVASGDRDAEGRPRIAGAHVDIGAYEYGSPLYTMLDATEVLRISAGLSICTPANVSRLDVVPESPGLTLADATLIAYWLLN